jgi:hypothetical protein
VSWIAKSDDSQAQHGGQVFVDRGATSTEWRVPPLADSMWWVDSDSSHPIGSVLSFSETEVETLLTLAMVYSLQGWLAELMGVRIDASGIAFPNRVFARFPYLVLFRRKLSKGSFDRVDFMKHSFVIYSSGEQIIVPITKRFNGIAVAKYLRHKFPKVSVALLY